MYWVCITPYIPRDIPYPVVSTTYHVYHLYAPVGAPRSIPWYYIHPRGMYLPWVSTAYTSVTCGTGYPAVLLCTPKCVHTRTWWYAHTILWMYAYPQVVGMYHLQGGYVGIQGIHHTTQW